MDLGLENGCATRSAKGAVLECRRTSVDLDGWGYRMLALRTLGGAEQILLPVFHEPSLISRWRLWARLVRVVGLRYHENGCRICGCLHLGLDVHRA